ncbi:hypothetical protein CEXT_241251 [Caerostris extrusa]|uniref:Uncharacterized protein n=1 Tax=Caerostris extrusa TaxID=172846 RepID=A0AAV4WLS8_CAEEX|nr:hypothetical protein CEXT_241251 [Caerostris extrusa]
MQSPDGGRRRWDERTIYYPLTTFSTPANCATCCSECMEPSRGASARISVVGVRFCLPSLSAHQHPRQICSRFLFSRSPKRVPGREGGGATPPPRMSDGRLATSRER